MPVIRNCNFIDIKKFWINAYGKSVVTLDGDCNQEKINISKSSKIINEEQRKDEEIKYIVYENDIAKNDNSRCPVCDSPVRSLKKLFKQDQCVICMDRAATTVITSCGHMCMCYECAVKCSEQNFNCPLCNQPIVSYRYMCDE